MNITSNTQQILRTKSVDNPLMPSRVYPQLCVVNDTILKSPKQTNKMRPDSPDTFSIADDQSVIDNKKEQKAKEKIPKALREQVWKEYCKHNVFETKCHVLWCNNKIDPFDFHVGHNIPEVRGGTLYLDNLRPICARCNLSMGSKYTIDEWNTLMSRKKSSPKFFKCSVM